MLSYQHGYHAGNFADVHKHTALCLILNELAKTNSIVTYIDTHSGRGLYDLRDEQSQKTGEWQDGIAKLVSQNITALGLKLYLEIFDKLEENHYPGSPYLIQQMMPDNHRAHLFELHPKEFEALQNNFSDDGRISSYHLNGIKDVFDFLPNRKSNGLVLIDPSYEMKTEYEDIPLFVKKLSKRWPMATIMVWYPLLKEGRHEAMKSALTGASFYEMEAPHQKQRMLGTGLALLNETDTFDTHFRDAVLEIKNYL